MIDPSQFEMASPHGLGLLVIRKEPTKCPLCGRSMKLWFSVALELGADSCLGCAPLPAPTPLLNDVRKAARL